MQLHQSSELIDSPGTSLFVTKSEIIILPLPSLFKTRRISLNVFTLSVAKLITQLLIATSTELSLTGILSSISPFRNSTLVKPFSLAAEVAFCNISSVKSMPITLPLSFTSLDARNASIPAPEPKSTTISPAFKLAKLIGAPQPRPNIDDFGIDSNDFPSYPTATDDNWGLASEELQYSGPQQLSECPLTQF